MIETERTSMRALERVDLKLRVQWLNDPIVRETLLLMVPISESQTNLWYEKILADPSREDFVIIHKESNAPIGFAGYINIDWRNCKAEPFIAIGDRDFWGKGIGTEVVHKLLDFKRRCFNSW